MDTGLLDEQMEMEVLQMQLTVFQEDFETERSDRERPQAEVLSLEDEVVALRQQDTDDTRLEAIFTSTSQSHQDTVGWSSRFSTESILSSVGIVVEYAVGMGINPFPRILAINSGEKGCLQFPLVWLVFLFLGSIQVIIMEYAIGRFTRRAAPMAWHDLLGVKSTWLGGWISIVNLSQQETASYDGTLLWKINYYTRKKHKAVNGRTLSLYCQTFYTSLWLQDVC
ncbi:uncharacterized protein LOC118404755 isoform X1 [Branchiostoma floridae]|uniref:Uncharacterized protein LOC118404755 isoform X1 n=1 Tax=Branchiostoma floridae TaxID=7739 RepID=A0A9J7KF62_BRAFL|nr:uncharacterized protein LOC118404755 isoform X1 [Branchiostoma floridae]